MIVRCIKKWHLDQSEKQITVGKIYLVLEVTLVQKQNKNDALFHMMSYRILNNNGVPGIYNAECFEVLSDKLDHMVILMPSASVIQITHKAFTDPIYEQKNANGFWGYLFESNSKQAIDVLQNAVIELNGDHIAIPEISLV